MASTGHWHFYCILNTYIADKITISNLKRAFKNTFYLEVLSLKVVHLPIACQSERSPCYFHLDRISDLFTMHRSSCHTLLQQQRKDSGPPIEIEWSLNFWASMPTLYVKKPRFCPKEKKFFLSHVGCFF